MEEREWLRLGRAVEPHETVPSARLAAGRRSSLDGFKAFAYEVVGIRILVVQGPRVSIVRTDTCVGTFHIGCKVENHIDREQAVNVPRALVDTGCEYPWNPSK